MLNSNWDGHREGLLVLPRKPDLLEEKKIVERVLLFL